jgi:hypothetical protein
VQTFNVRNVHLSSFSHMYGYESVWAFARFQEGLLHSVVKHHILIFDYWKVLLDLVKTIEFAHSLLSVLLTLFIFVIFNYDILVY